MSIGKHTPGPWLSEAGWQGAKRVQFVTAKGVDGLRPWTDADANLIAAAPDLLQACREAVKAIEVELASIIECHSYETSDNRYVDAREDPLACEAIEEYERVRYLLMAAITKAEGRQ